MFFKLAGSEFHEQGPETEKERGPKVLVRVRGLRRLSCAADRNGRRCYRHPIVASTSRKGMQGPRREGTWRRWDRVCRLFSVGLVASEASPGCRWRQDRTFAVEVGYQPRGGSQYRLKLAEQLVGYARQQTVAIIEPAVYDSMHQLGAGPSREWFRRITLSCRSW